MSIQTRKNKNGTVKYTVSRIIGKKCITKSLPAGSTFDDAVEFQQVWIDAEPPKAVGRPRKQ